MCQNTTQRSSDATDFFQLKNSSRFECGLNGDSWEIIYWPVITASQPIEAGGDEQLGLLQEGPASCCTQHSYVVDII